MKKIKNKKIIFLGILSAILVVGLSLITCMNINNSFKLDHSDLVVNIQNSEKLKLSKKFVKNDSTSYTITANVTPTEAANKQLVWSLSYTDGTDSSDISSYVNIVVASDTLSATIKYVKVFDKQIILKVTSVANSSVTATCTIDCYERISSVDTISLKFDNFGLPESQNSDYFLSCDDIKEDGVNVIDFSGFNKMYQWEDNGIISIDLEYSKRGTVSNNSISYYFNLNATEDLKDILTANNRSYGMSGFTFSCDDGTISGDLSDYITFKRLFSLMFYDNLDTDLTANDLEIISKCSNWFDLTLIISDGLNYSKSVCFKLVNFDISDLVNVSNINLTETELIFQELLS